MLEDASFMHGGRQASRRVKSLLVVGMDLRSFEESVARL